MGNLKQNLLKTLNNISILLKTLLPKYNPRIWITVLFLLAVMGRKERRKSVDEVLMNHGYPGRWMSASTMPIFKCIL